MNCGLFFFLVSLQAFFVVDFLDLFSAYKFWTMTI